MELRESLVHLSDNYIEQKEEIFTGNVLANHLRKVIPSLVASLLGAQDRYYVKGSAGQSNWANIPWIAIMDLTITKSPQNGFYLVYLLREDGKGLYLSLNQGVTDLKKKYGRSVSRALEISGSDFREQLKYSKNGLIEGPIDLAASQKGSLGNLYEHGAIYSLYYESGNFPDNETLENDLEEFITLYLQLVLNLSVGSSGQAEDDEMGLSIEDGTKLRQHKRVERNQALSKKVKKVQGFTCKACGFDFEKKYGEVGKGFIEAHHLTPVSEIKGRKVGLDPVKDFAVLCSNCHRMIHKTEFVDKVEEFRTSYIVS
ncbi:MrcB family domain-containing protein [Photobacterium leiognathi]|uniref:MrcB family domain-containing protein n=1 Tax=Photobacterium leiognathi TaxID=553611 RepID=UPI002739FDD7|nr:DUF3578 domain-containing protein [Photobacterium leiognathi]